MADTHTSTKLVGQGIDRRDGPDKVTGAAKYAAEFDLPNVAHAVLVQSNIPAGKITGFNIDDVNAMPGVLAVITPQNALKMIVVKDSSHTITRPLLQDASVLFNGQHVAVVVADTLERAEMAAAALQPSYQRADASIDIGAAMGKAYTPQQFQSGRQPADTHRGDVATAFAHAPVKIEASYSTPIEHHNPMEPHATIARWDGDSVAIWSATEGISDTQKTIAGLFGLPEQKVHVIDPYVGGGFGCKVNTWPPATLAVMAARMVNKPVKLVLSRRQMFTSNGYRPYTLQKLQLAAEKTGKLLAIRHDTVSGMSDQSLGEYAEPCGLATQMLYSCPNVAVSHRVVPVNLPLPTYMRAPGEASGVFALEVAMDELAYALNMDPLALRLMNYAERDEYENKPFSSKRLRECYAQAAETFGWAKRSSAPRSMRDGNALIGMGMATATYPANRSPAKARIRIFVDGSAVVQSGTQDAGTGTYTVMAQVTADELGLPIERVRFELGDSDFPAAPISSLSQTVASVAPAVQAACAAMRAQLLNIALDDPALGLSGTHAQAIRFENGDLVGPAHRVSIGQVLARKGVDVLEADGASDAGHGHDGHSLHSFGAQFAEVRVDADLGEVRVSRFVGVFDAGRILNPKTAHSQIVGGITLGIGMALLEESLVDKASGRFLNADLAGYLLPVNADIPAIQASFIEADDRLVDPLGARGLGDLPVVGAAAAVVNAVYHATGMRIRDLPVRMEQLLSV